MSPETAEDHDIFMNLALAEAEAALDRGEFPVGCVLESGGAVIAAGRRDGTAGAGTNEIDHAEMVLLRRLSETGADLDLRQARLYCTMEPCLMCFGAILLSGIGQIVYAFEDVMGGGTGCDLARLPPLYRSRRIRIVPRVCREKSLALFKAYFSNPANAYWRDSLLARYTLTAE